GLSDQERAYGIHGGDIETSILLACRPDLVRRDFAPSSLPTQLERLKHPPFMGPLTFGWLTEDLTDNGVLGDDTTANADRGEIYLNQAAAEVAELLQEIQAFHFDLS
ncbi:MAG: creatininase family protein, partial [Anaerolineales bacterium]